MINNDNFRVTDWDFVDESQSPGGAPKAAPRARDSGPAVRRRDRAARGRSDSETGET